MKISTSKYISKQELKELQLCLNALHQNLELIDQIGERIIETLKRGNTVFACGNGGSATDSMHLCEELVGRYRDDRPALPAISLNTDTSVISCIANDYGFEQIFARQLKALGKKNDLLIAFSTSGNSENIVQAIEAANSKEIATVLITGQDTQSRAARIAHTTLNTPAKKTARIQELHRFTMHVWLEQVEQINWTGECNRT